MVVMVAVNEKPKQRTSKMPRLPRVIGTKAVAAINAPLVTAEIRYQPRTESVASTSGAQIARQVCGNRLNPTRPAMAPTLTPACESM